MAVGRLACATAGNVLRLITVIYPEKSGPRLNRYIGWMINAITDFDLHGAG